MPNQQDILDDEQQPTASELLFEEYAHHFESFEDFCNRMCEEHGTMWVYLFNRKSKDK